MRKMLFEDLNIKEIQDTNGGGVGGFIVGYLIGSTVALVGTPVLVVAGRSEDEVQTFIYSSLITGGAIGAMFTGPV